MENLVTTTEIEVITTYKKEIAGFRTRTLDAESIRAQIPLLDNKEQQIQKKYVVSLQQENVRVLNSSDFFQKKEKFQQTLLGIKQRFIDEQVDTQYPTIMNYTFLHGADSSYALLIKVEEELIKAFKYKKILQKTA